ncbi:DUF4253 domain-containing protein [Spongiactinospora sp. TRM90649]|uniref:DUF4253 domain-containing protein n=1 Tax=Spongiactinospora sp. TRM90649 TaxID=3031114 RepID=UPI0023F9311B|nr:DUF4253 domain-containing protein [Spongiactinospora sp. TRM90649]MDF5753206.1 DUF4253 domain-containing protein [Spongiactinospora sp. TRM90649]
MDERERGGLPTGLGKLFADGGTGRSLAVDLPPGGLVWPDPGYAPGRSCAQPAFWISDEPGSGELWAALRAEHAHSGLWPVLLEESVQPWAAGQIAPDVPEEIDNYKPAQFMAEVWEDWCELAHPDQIEDLAPFGDRCPGLAAPGRPMAPAEQVADWYAGVLAERGMPLGLAAVRRGADALAVMGWQGALHHNEWTPPLAAVVRSWEERFGARVVAVGFNTLELSVAAPPTTYEHTLHVAAEHWAFCPDSIVQGPGTLEEYAEQIAGVNAWSFWWD